MSSLLEALHHLRQHSVRAAARQAGVGEPISVTEMIGRVFGALTLSGGASHGDFEVGVVRYLYDVAKVRPKIICGTSVGAIAALKLAEGEPEEGAQAARGG